MLVTKHPSQSRDDNYRNIHYEKCQEYKPFNLQFKLLFYYLHSKVNLFIMRLERKVNSLKFNTVAVQNNICKSELEFGLRLKISCLILFQYLRSSRVLSRCELITKSMLNRKANFITGKVAKLQRCSS